MNVVGLTNIMMPGCLFKRFWIRVPMMDRLGRVDRPLFCDTARLAALIWVLGCEIIIRWYNSILELSSRKWRSTRLSTVSSFRICRHCWFLRSFFWMEIKVSVEFVWHERTNLNSIQSTASSLFIGIPRSYSYYVRTYLWHLHNSPSRITQNNKEKSLILPCSQNGRVLHLLFLTGVSRSVSGLLDGSPNYYPFHTSLR